MTALFDISSPSAIDDADILLLLLVAVVAVVVISDEMISLALSGPPISVLFSPQQKGEKEICLNRSRRAERQEKLSSLFQADREREGKLLSVDLVDKN
jgi:hypothetical protein